MYAEAMDGLRAAEAAVLATSANAVFTGVVGASSSAQRLALLGLRPCPKTRWA
jgi:hypothetical protein